MVSLYLTGFFNQSFGVWVLSFSCIVIIHSGLSGTNHTSPHLFAPYYAEIYSFNSHWAVTKWRGFLIIMRISFVIFRLLDRMTRLTKFGTSYLVLYVKRVGSSLNHYKLKFILFIETLLKNIFWEEGMQWGEVTGKCTA